jgi:hypothetical protein
MKKRIAVLALLFTGWYSGCSADLGESNRCYSLANAACSSYRADPYSECLSTLQGICQDESSLEGKDIDDCIDAFKRASGDAYRRCPEEGAGGEILSTGCREVRSSAGRLEEALFSFPLLCTGGGSLCTNTCQWAYDGECDEGTYCDYGTDCYDCRSSTPSCTNTCTWAYDGECDEPNLCSRGTDCADCGSSSPAPSPTPSCTNTCTWAYDGECDEPGLCSPGTDCADCGSSSCTNTCQWAYDDECDEGTYCPYWTDCYDCRGGG